MEGDRGEKRRVNEKLRNILDLSGPDTLVKVDLKIKQSFF
jgi:hypothetical protein